MKCSINKQWVLPLTIGTIIILSLAGVTQAFPQAEPAQPRFGPLPSNDPGAQLDPNLMNVPAMPEQKTDSSPKFPLSPNDPAAKLNPNLMNVPAMPEQKTDSSPKLPSTQSPVKEISHNLRTGSTQVGENKPVKPDSTSASVSPPNIGANSNVEPEFPR